MEDNNTDNNLLLEELSAICDGLFWLSESDYPWQIIYWQDEPILTSQVLYRRYDYSPGTQILTQSLPTLFKSAITDQSWHEENEKLQTQRYRDLYHWLTINLQDIEVFLVGKIEIDVYVLGKVNNNSIMGLFTKAIET